MCRHQFIESVSTKVYVNLAVNEVLRGKDVKSSVKEIADLDSILSCREVETDKAGTKDIVCFFQLDVQVKENYSIRHVALS